MKIKDLVAIAKLRMSKKYMSSICALIAFAFFSLLILGYIYFESKNIFKIETNDVEYVLRVGYKDETFIKDMNIQYIYTLSEEQFKKDTNNAHKVITWQELAFSEYLDPKDVVFSIDGGALENRELSGNIKILSDKDLLTPFSSKDFEFYEKGYTDKKEEIIVSQKFLDKHNLSNNVLGHEMSMYINVNNLRNTETYVDTDIDVFNTPIFESTVNYGEICCFKNYKIIGIVKNSYYLHKSINDDCDLWIKKDSLTSNDGITSIKGVKQYNNKCVVTYYDNNIKKLASTITDDGGFFPLYCAMSYYFYGDFTNNFIFPEYRTYVCFSSLKDVKESAALINDSYQENGALNKIYEYYSPNLISVIRLKDISFWLNLVLSIALVLSVLSTIVVMQNMFTFMIVEKNEFFLFLEKVGMTKKDRILSMILQLAIIIMISCIISALCGSILIIALVGILKTTILPDLVFNLKAFAISCSSSLLIIILIMAIISSLVMEKSKHAI